jgi:hypothetical protein
MIIKGDAKKAIEISTWLREEHNLTPLSDYFWNMVRFGDDSKIRIECKDKKFEALVALKFGD